MSTRVFLTTLLAFTFTLGACVPQEPPKQAPASSAAAKPGDLLVAQSDPVRERQQANCQQLIAPDISRRTALPTNDATEAGIRRLGELVPEWAACAREGWLDRDLYRQGLLTVRNVMTAWYEQAPRLCAHALTSDTSAEDQGQSIAPAADLAQLHLFIERELEQIDKALEHPSPVLAEDLRRRSLILAMMTTDSLVGVVSERMGATAPRVPPVLDKSTEPLELDDALARLGPALEREAVLWGDDVFTANPGTEVEEKPARAKGRGITLQTRLDFVSQQTRRLSNLWTRPNDDLRLSLGHPYDRYVGVLADADERVRGAGKGPFAWQWIEAVHDLSGKTPSRSVSFEMPLRRIQTEIALDGFNLRATYSWFDADRRVRELFAFDAPETGDTAKINTACHNVVEAARRTDSPFARLSALSLLVVSCDLEDGQSTGTAAATPTPATGATSAAAQATLLARRRRGSRHLAETALCELNRSWIGGPACSVTMDGLSAIEAGDPCRLPAQPTSPPIPAPPWLIKAYGRVLATLAPVSTWTAGSPPDPGVSSRTRCELARLTGGVAHRWVPLELDAYEHLTRILVERSIVVSADDAGAMLANAMDLAENEALSACQKLPLCTPASVAAEAQRRRGATSNPTAQMNATAYQDHYCEVIHHGAQVAELAAQPRSPAQTGQSLLALGRPALRPPSEAAFLARGNDMIAKSSACSSLASTSASPTASTSAPARGGP